MSDHFVHIYKTGAMRELQQFLARGYVWYVSGTVEPHRLHVMVCKFLDRYEIDRSKNRRYSAKKRGESNCHLVSWLDRENHIVRWWLVVTEGYGLVTEMENLVDATSPKSRLTLTGYEMVKLPRKGQKATWTWRMTKDTYSSWSGKVRSAFRNNNTAKQKQILYSLPRSPGFYGARQQVWDLIQQARADWKRAQSMEWPYGRIMIPWEGRYRTAAQLAARTISERARRRRKLVKKGET